MLKNFFKFIFSTGFSIEWARRYEKYGVVRKVLILILTTILTAGSIILELYSFTVFSENIIMGIIFSILWIALAFIAVRINMYYSTLAFRMAKNGTVILTIFGKNKNKQNQEQVSTTETQSTDNATLDNIIQPKKSHKWLDYLIGIFGFIYGLGLIITLVVLLLNVIKK